ncbi:hypothetical protein NXS98_07435 [Fontisphaera persica]|uniref:hypothetical protein n=1 Tax=Fontisphaera persica TaxID=2974023 RepID=UPI0024C0D822|nr:hypothetical protein [Fontisphaera persica]WCJ60942.1 hypothetical protein NXS98_07435 [Fontisphaera persica]
MKSPGVFLAISATVMAFGLFACAKSESGLVRALERWAQAATATTNSTVAISAVTDFAWDKLFIFGPYTPVDRIHAQLGFKWAEAEKTHIDSSDTFYLLVFVKSSNVVRHVKLPRTVGDFQGLESQNVFAHGSDTFKVLSTDAGKTRGSLFPPRSKIHPNRNRAGVPPKGVKDLAAHRPRRRKVGHPPVCGRDAQAGACAKALVPLCGIAAECVASSPRGFAAAGRRVGVDSGCNGVDEDANRATTTG